MTRLDCLRRRLGQPPVGRPSASRSIRPPSGSGVSLVDAGALKRARVDVCRVPAPVLDPDRMIGRRGVQVGTGQRTAFARLRVVVLEPQHPAVLRRLRGPLADGGLMSSMDRRSQSTSRRCRRPALPGCECASMKPGTTVLPPTSTRFVRGPAAASRSLDRPTARIRPSRIDTASARGAAAPIVRICALCRTISGSDLQRQERR